MKKRNLYFFLVVFLINGCSYKATINRSPYVDRLALSEMVGSRPAKTPEQIKLIREIPDKSFVIIGTMHAPKVELTAHYDNDNLIKAMRKLAVSLRADAILDYRTTENPTVVPTGSVSRYYGGSVMGIPYKGLHAWAEAIIFVTEAEKEIIEPND